MWTSVIITFRETLEVALVIGILLSFLTKTNQLQLRKFVWLGLFVGMLSSLFIAFLLNMTVGEFAGRAENIFEGILMLATAGFLTWMILWVHRQKGVVKQLQAKAREHIDKGYPIGLLFLTVSSVMREGVETVFYLRAVSTISHGNQFIGALIGILIAGILGYAIFRYSLKINLPKLLKISGAMLLLFSAGMVSHGVHAFQEAGILPIFSFDPLINLTRILDHTSFFGNILSTLFGYTATPTMLQLFSYGTYVFLIFMVEVLTDKHLARQLPPKK